MAFNRDGFIKAAREAGRPEEEIQAFLVKKAQTPQIGSGSSLAQGARTVSNALSSVGLGAIPSIAGAGYEVARSFGGNDAYVNPETRQTIENPFIPQKKLANMSGAFESPEGLGKAAVSLGRDELGLASWGLPSGKGATLAKTLVAKAGTGAARGAMYGASQQDAGAKEIIGAATVGGIAEPALALAQLGAGKVLNKGKEMVGKAVQKVKTGDIRNPVNEFIYKGIETPVKASDKVYNHIEVQTKLDNIIKEYSEGRQPEVKEILRKLSTSRTPATLEVNPEFPVGKLLEESSRTGRELADRAGLEKDVYLKVKRVLTDEIKRLVPETIPEYAKYHYAKVAEGFLSRYGKQAAAVGLFFLLRRKIGQIFAPSR